MAMPSMAPRLDGARPRTRVERPLGPPGSAWRRRRRSPKTVLELRGSRRTDCRRCSTRLVPPPEARSRRARRPRTRSDRPGESLRAFSYSPERAGEDPRRRVVSRWRAHDTHPAASVRARRTSRQPAGRAPPARARERSCCRAARRWRETLAQATARRPDPGPRPARRSASALRRLAGSFRLRRGGSLLALEEGVVGGEVLRGLVGELLLLPLAASATPSASRDLRRDVGLHLEDVGQRRVERLLPARGGRPRLP